MVSDISPAQLEKIEKLLDSIERDHEIRILYACESGSRAWGFASPDSDYDIRFLYAHQKSKYLGLFDPAETINLAIEDELDPEGWDIRKVLRLLMNSNGSLIEWLHSPIVYRDQGFAAHLREQLPKVIDVNKLATHYAGMTKSSSFKISDTPKPRPKDYFYALRAMGAALWVMENSAPAPVPFDQLRPMFPNDLQPIIDDLLITKSEGAEAQRIEPVDAIDEWLAATLEETKARLDAMPSRDIDPGALLPIYHRWTGITSSFQRIPAKSLTLSRIRQPDMLLFEAVGGSHAYGTAIETSDRDLRGVFAAPLDFLVGPESIEQVSDTKSDEVYYELSRYLDLLAKNNPNAIELVAMPRDCIVRRHPVMDLVKPEMFLSKLCSKSFAGYAMGQVSKARGLNKKIVNPEPEIRRSLIEFCHVLDGQGSVPLTDWLTHHGYAQEDCGLVATPHAPGMYALFHDRSANYRGILSRKDDAVLLCSSVEREAQPVAWISCNVDGFKTHCRRHREYWIWCDERNEARYENNAEHGKGYDSKNMMHTLRLLDMALEIARDGVVHVRRPNRDFLLKVRAGDFSYEELVEKAEARLAEVNSAFANSSLPDTPNHDEISDLLLEMRSALRG